MLLHNDESSFYIQGSTDFVVVAHPKHDHATNSKTVILERILEARASRASRDAHYAQMQAATHSAVPAVPAVPGVPAVFAASNNFDPEEKQEIRFGRTQYGLEVLCHDFHQPPLAGPTRDVDVEERTPPLAALVGTPSGVDCKPPWVFHRSTAAACRRV